VTRKLLARPAGRRAAQPPTPAEEPRPVVAPVAVLPPARARVLRRPVVLVLVAACAAVLAGLGWTELSSSGTDVGVAAGVLAGPHPASPSASAGGTAPGVPSSGRNPFADRPAPVVTVPTTPPHVAGTPTASPTTSPATRPTGKVSPSAAGSPGASAAPTVTVTVTAPATATYVGLYAWNGSRASFRVNARTYSVHLGVSFGPGLTFTAVVPGTPRCARVSGPKGSFTLCPGQFVTVH
jgi:hypothetical protein